MNGGGEADDKYDSTTTLDSVESNGSTQVRDKGMFTWIKATFLIK